MDFQVEIAKSDAEREAVYRLRYQTLVEELGWFQDVADHERRLLRDAHDDDACLLALRAGGQVVGAMRINFGADAPFGRELLEAYELERFRAVVPFEQMSVFTRFMVRRDLRGSFAPLALIRESTRLNVERGVELGFCDCHPHFLNLYVSLGFRTYRSSYNDPQLGIQVPLVQVAGDHEHLERIGSPLRGAARGTPEIARRVLPLLGDHHPVHAPALDGEAAYFGEVFGILSERDAAEGHAFAGLSEEDVRTVVASSHVLECDAGSVVIRRGHAARMVHVVLRGALEVMDDDRVVAVAGPGEIVGEVAFLLGGRRLSDVRAGSGGAQMLCLEEKALRRLIESQSRIAAVLLLNLSRSLALKLAQRIGRR